MASSASVGKEGREDRLVRLITRTLLDLLNQRGTVRALALRDLIEEETGIRADSGLIRQATRGLVSQGIVSPAGDGRNRRYTLLACQ